MPPKLSAAQIDGKLEELHVFVGEHADLLATRNGSSLRDCLSQRASAEERGAYLFLARYEPFFCVSATPCSSDLCSLGSTHHERSAITVFAI